MTDRDRTCCGVSSGYLFSPVGMTSHDAFASWPPEPSVRVSKLHLAEKLHERDIENWMVSNVLPFAVAKYPDRNYYLRFDVRLDGVYIVQEVGERRTSELLYQGTFLDHALRSVPGWALVVRYDEPCQADGQRDTGRMRKEVKRWMRANATSYASLLYDDGRVAMTFMVSPNGKYKVITGDHPGCIEYSGRHLSDAVDVFNRNIILLQEACSGDGQKT